MSQALPLSRPRLSFRLHPLRILPTPFLLHSYFALTSSPHQVFTQRTLTPHFCRGSTPNSHSEPTSSPCSAPSFPSRSRPTLVGCTLPPPTMLRPTILPPHRYPSLQVPPHLLPSCPASTSSHHAPPHTSLQVPPLSEHQWGAGLMAAREGPVGRLSRGVSYSRCRGNSRRQHELRKGGRRERGLSGGSAGNAGKRRARYASRISPYSSAPASVPLLCLSSSSSVSPGTPPLLGSPQK